MQFDEEVFLYAMTTRPEDARKYSQLFQPDWLRTVEYRPILAEIFGFLKEHSVPPDLKTLHKVFKDKDSSLYHLRIKDPLDALEEVRPETPEVLYTLDQVNDVCVVRSLQHLFADQNFLKHQSNFEGKKILNDINKWLNLFLTSPDEQTLNIKEALEKMVEEYNFDEAAHEKIPTGILPLDQWTGGGSKAGQLDIILAPTGEGKSTLLLNMAFRMAFEHNVWFFTNELDIVEQSERFLARMSGKPLSLIQRDPYGAYSGLGSHWQNKLHEKLIITAVNREVSMQDVESTMARWTNLLGWKPRVLVLDFMERMKPIEYGYSRAQEWKWIEAIARDICRFAKRHKILVWTAAQMNRSGLNAKIALAEQAQGSIRHLQEASLVTGIFQNTVPLSINEDQEVLDFFQIKNRHGKRDKRPIRVKVDLEKMMITNDVVEFEAPEVYDEEIENSSINRKSLLPNGKK